MTLLGDYVSRMVEGGMDRDEAVQIAAEIFAAGAAQEAAKPSSGALRTRKWRINKASQSVTSDAEENDNESVTKRHKSSQSVTCDNSPPSIDKSNKNKKGARLSHDWSPSETERDFAKQLGWSESQIDSEAANFRDYWIARPGSGGLKLDWPATWRKWIRSSKVKPAGRSGIVQAIDRDWEAAASSWAKFRRWPRGHGPDPDSPTCQCPREIIQKHLGAA